MQLDVYATVGWMLATGCDGALVEEPAIGGIDGIGIVAEHGGLGRIIGCGRELGQEIGGRRIADRVRAGRGSARRRPTGRIVSHAARAIGLGLRPPTHAPRPPWRHAGRR